MPLWLEKAVLHTVDALHGLARHSATAQQLAACRIVSHRGERDDRAVFENTCAAYDPLRGSGVFGIEFDVRWTQDLVPVVFHDPDLRRLHGDAARIRDLTWRELHERRPEIPDLASFVQRYAGEFHLMCEVKHERYPDPPLQSRRLAQALAPALERQRCTVLSLEPGMFGALPDIPAAATMGVARLNTAAISAEALAQRRAGFSAHYALIDAATIAAHHAAGQTVGCGFPPSRALLYREAARGVDFVFTDQARQLERWRRQGADSLPA